MKILILKCSVSAMCYQVIVPPMGALYLSAFLKKSGYSSVKVLHLDAVGMRPEELEAELLRYKPDIVCLSAITAEGKSMHALARLAKELLPGTLVVAGGPHPTGYTADCMGDPAIDIAVRGEGELTLLEIVKAREAGKSFDGITGITWRRGGEVVSAPDREYISDLDRLPFPDWEAVDIRVYEDFVPQAPVHFKTPYATIVTSRGCPFHCTFCHNIHGKKFRAHSAARVLSELKYLHDKFGLTEIEIIDDIFNWDRGRTVEIMNGIIASGVKFKLYLANGVRADVLDRETIDLFARAGVVFLSAGIETSSPAAQKAIKKNIRFPELKSMLDYAVSRGIFTHSLFMIGFPGETVREVIGTLRFACSLKSHTVLFSYACAYLGSELGNTLEDKTSLVTPANDRSSAFSARQFVNCSPISSWKLILLRQLANIVFFMNPARIYRICRDLPGRNRSMLFLISKKFLDRTVLLR